ncbi:MAG: hypothetical protein IPP35_00975 [Elusimicrobia bacterium]|nr:hypothetical protein [Elusimicrobiota bacterium]
MNFQLEGVGPKTAEILQKGGWGDVARLSTANPDDLTALSGIGEKTAEKIIEAAQSFLAKKAAGDPAVSEAATDPIAEKSEETSATIELVASAGPLEDSGAPPTVPEPHE